MHVDPIPCCPAGRGGRAGGADRFRVVVAPAGATGPVYPGETLTLTQGAPAVVGLETGFVAAGQQAVFEDYPLGFDFAAFVKDATVDPACSAELHRGAGRCAERSTEQQVTAPTLFQGTDATFTIPFKLNFARAGTFLLCGYSEYLDDTAAATSVTVTVTNPVPPARRSRRTRRRPRSPARARG